MRLVDRVAGFGSTPPRRERATDVIQPLSADRALVVIAPAAASARGTGVSGRPGVTFLTQLIATKQGLAQTRTRRRVGVGEALGAYRMTAKSGPTVAHRLWGRSI